MKIPFQVKAYGALALFAAVVIAKLWWDDRKVSPSAPPPPPVDMSRMSLAQAIVHCRALWLQQHWDQAPLAIAWHSQGLDWYVQAGVDSASMRRVSCTGQGVGGGARFVRVLNERVPEGGGLAQSQLQARNLFDYYAKLPATDAVALEAVQDPQDKVTAPPIERRWAADGSLQAPINALANFPVLMSQRPANWAAASYPALQGLKSTRWLEQPDAAFALLAKELPPEARISELKFGNFGIDVTINGSFGNAEGRPHLPYGDASFDEYGVRAFDSFYPREITSNSCTPGYTLAQVKALYAERINANRTDATSASFGCNNNVKQPGVWYVRVPRKR